MDLAVGDANICDYLLKNMKKLYCSVPCTDSEKRQIDKMLKEKLHSGKENVIIIISPIDVSTSVLKLNADKNDGSLGAFQIISNRHQISCVFCCSLLLFLCFHTVVHLISCYTQL